MILGPANSNPLLSLFNGETQQNISDWWNAPVTNRYNFLPMAENANTGETLLALPGIIGGIYDSAKRIAERGVGQTVYDDAGVPIRGRGSLEPLDGLNVAGAAPVGTMALGSLARAIPEGAMGAGPVRAAAELPMDQASRLARAQEMGFDTDRVLYHGTGKIFDEFNPGMRGNGTARNIYLTDNPEIADIYANSQNYGLKGGGDPMIYPLFAKAEKPLAVSDKGPDGSFGWVSDNLAAALGVDSPPPGKYAELYDEARRQGYDQVRIREMTDLGGSQTQYIPLKPEYIRSVNAAFDPAMSDSANLLAANPDTAAAAPMALNALDQPATKGFTAYHGSPHDFDKFDISKVGTGEGAQAYGHGLYFAENEGVARSYRDAVTLRNSVPDDLADAILKAHNGDRQAAVKYIDEFSNAESMSPAEAASMQTARAHIGDENWSPPAPNAGRMYEVRINADPEQFLDWDKPLSQQSEAVRSVIGIDDLSLKGGDALDELARKVYSDPSWEPSMDGYGGGKGQARGVVSNRLKESGIPGIRYLDQMSRNAGDGSRNYVLFDDSLVDIMRKYANAPTGAAAPLAINSLEAMGAGPVRAAAGLSAELSMDQAQRLARARETGFDTNNTWYRGSISPSRSEMRHDTFWSNDPEFASNYAMGHGELKPDELLNSNVVPAYHRGKYFSFDNPEHLSALTRDQPGLSSAYEARFKGRKTWPLLESSDMQKWLRKSGFDGADMMEGGKPTRMVFEPRNIRSVNAAFDPAQSGSANLLAANPDTAAAAPLALNALDQPATKGFTAYHGSPHDFDKFDLSKIGTGEGAQAYGHGLYFAEKEGVARSYRNNLALKDSYGWKVGDEVYDSSNPLHSAARYLHEAGVLEKAIDAAKSARARTNSMFKGEQQRSAHIDHLNKVIGLLESGNIPDLTHSKPGKMYEVRIKADPEQFIDLDKPLSGQTEAVRNALLQKALTDADANYIPPVDVRTPEVASKLREAGIPGIRYLDQMSRDAGGGSRNYVLFDDSLVDIMRKYANAPTGAAAPLAINGQGDGTDLDINALLRRYGLLGE